jgi:type II secretory pathway pseudopilin PulG
MKPRTPVTSGSSCRRTPQSPFKPGLRAFTLIEVLVYMGVFTVLMGLGFATLFTSIDNSTALRCGADDIVNALHAGERWRSDVRSSNAAFLEGNPAGPILRLSGSHGEVSYRFADHTLFRRLGTGPWMQALTRVKTAGFVSEPRANLAVWRCELELQKRSRKSGGLRPLFTFVAVSAPNSSQ